MERSFMVTKESKYLQDLNKVIVFSEQQREFVKKFFIEEEIETSVYMMGGNGFMNCSFEEYNKKGIRLSIQPSENDLIKFCKMLCKPDENNLYAFKKSSKISKEFSQKCVNEKIVINLSGPRISDYFESLGCYGCSYSQFPNGENLYIKVESKHLKETDVVEGFIEIKLSDFYIAKEKFESENRCNEV
ncbi:hypothetical protein [Clostridium estertheticum]|uniref:Uncharacterized protein n=1 Tax=Clostridium estertheticum subsp. estertheticum TaxID=1552 RepID=A0A1J0GKX7_9CLOT|nr:hypothetical protein [Clostridium estertheticum]APC41550.1 hypothetical protein A7L45_16430 [Clostridium estertheticum subsp. estertheticum]